MCFVWIFPSFHTTFNWQKASRFTHVANEARLHLQLVENAPAPESLGEMICSIERLGDMGHLDRVSSADPVGWNVDFVDTWTEYFWIWIWLLN